MSVGERYEKTQNSATTGVFDRTLGTKTPSCGVARVQVLTPENTAELGIT